MMRQRRVGLMTAAIVAALTACQDQGPAGDLDGTWQTAPIPSGGYITMSLTTSGSQVNGSGAEYGLISAPKGGVTVVGSRTNGSFLLTVHPAAGATAQPARYTGSVVGAELHGTWEEAGQSYPLAFYRQP